MAATEVQLKELGEKLQAVAPAPADQLAKLLEKVVECSQGIEQSPESSVMEAIQPSQKAVTREELLNHEDDNVKVLLATCFCEITRITAPYPPYNDDILRDMFYLIVGTFGGLRDVNSQSFGRRVAILETVAGCRTCVLMLDLECDDLITNMFQTFLGVVSDSHEENIVKSMQTIMSRIIDDSEEVEESLLRVLLSALVQKKTGAAMSARKLARSVIEHSATKLEPFMKKFLMSSSTGNGSSSNDQINLYQCAPKVLKVIVLGDNIDLYQSIPKAERSENGQKENVMEGTVILGDNIEKIIKVQQDWKVEDEKITEAQIQISNANLKAAKEQKEAKMFEVYNSLIIQGTRHMSKDQKASRDRALRKLEEKLFAA